MSAILNQITIGSLRVAIVDQDPRLLGLDLAIGSLVMVEGQGGIYQKQGSASTEWTLVSTNADQLEEDLAALGSRLDALEADPVTKSYVDAADAALQTAIDTLSQSLTVDGLADVSAPAPMAGDVLRFDGAQWINEAAVSAYSEGGDGGEGEGSEQIGSPSIITNADPIVSDTSLIPVNHAVTAYYRMTKNYGNGDVPVVFMSSVEMSDMSSNPTTKIYIGGVEQYSLSQKVQNVATDGSQLAFATVSGELYYTPYFGDLIPSYVQNLAQGYSFADGLAIYGSYIFGVNASTSTGYIYNTQTNQYMQKNFWTAFGVNLEPKVYIQNVDLYNMLNVRICFHTQDNREFSFSIENIDLFQNTNEIWVAKSLPFNAPLAHKFYLLTEFNESLLLGTNDFLSLTNLETGQQFPGIFLYAPDVGFSFTATTFVPSTVGTSFYYATVNIIAGVANLGVAYVAKRISANVSEFEPAVQQSVQQGTAEIRVFTPDLTQELFYSTIGAFSLVETPEGLRLNYSTPMGSAYDHIISDLLTLSSRINISNGPADTLAGDFLVKGAIDDALGFSLIVVPGELLLYSGGGEGGGSAGKLIKANESGRLDQSFLQYNINFGENALSGIATPENPDHAANKTYVDGQDSFTYDSAVNMAASYTNSAVSAEQTAREAADASLQSQIDTEKGRVDAILLASDADKDSFAEIVNLINSVDTENDSAFASYVLSNDAALAQEVLDRQSGDSTLQSNIDAEEARAEAAESALAGRLDVLEGADTVEGSVAKAEKDAKDYTDAAVALETSAREAADETLQDNIDAEQSARQAADLALSGRLDILEGSDTTEGSVAKAEKDAKDYTDAEISAEETARMAADSALSARLDTLEGADTVEGSVAKAEKDAKDYADAAVAAEAALRESADSNLQSQIDTEKGRIDAILLASDADKDSFAEIVQLINSVDTENDSAFASYVLSNDAALAQEVSDRQSADSALSGRLDILEGDATTEGSVAKAEQDAKDYADAAVAAEQARAEAAEALKLNKAGDTMSGDLNMGGNDVVNVGALGLGTETPSAMFEMVESGATLNLKGHSVSTSDTNATELVSYSPASNSVELLKVFITGIDTTTMDSVTYEKTVKVKNSGGAVTLGAIQSDYTSEDSSLIGASCFIEVSGTAVKVKVVGISAAMEWTCFVQKVKYVVAP